jgi:hypothetical protein
VGAHEERQREHNDPKQKQRDVEAFRPRGLATSEAPPKSEPNPS